MRFIVAALAGVVLVQGYLIHNLMMNQSTMVHHEYHYPRLLMADQNYKRSI